MPYTQILVVVYFTSYRPMCTLYMCGYGRYRNKSLVNRIVVLNDLFWQCIYIYCFNEQRHHTRWLSITFAFHEIQQRAQLSESIAVFLELSYS